uniref:NADH dehydrogenase subunit 2 n=1 Tax=Meteora sporadica TaxID=2913902 RepID=UPI0030024531|nr:NADH dehydrogenase subunit 2 [Meteora sporadica]
MNFYSEANNCFNINVNYTIPEIYLTTAILILLVYGVVNQKILITDKHYQYPILTTSVNWLSIYVLVITLILNGNNHQYGVSFNNMLHTNDFISFFKMLLIIATIATLLISLDYLKRNKTYIYEYGVLILLSVLSMLLLLSSFDFISMYLAVEFQSLCFYILATSKRTSKMSTEAGLKYFILGAFSSCILLFGISLIYGFSGTTSFSDLYLLFNGAFAVDFLQNYAANPLFIGLMFIIVGLLFKLTAVPFHMWAPDVYEGSPTNVTAFFLIVPKIAVFGFFIELFFSVFHDLVEWWQPIMIFSSLASMMLASFAALYQKKIKRLLAYSAIGHVGYLLIALANFTQFSLESFVIYIVIYVAMSVGFFGSILALQNKHTSSSNKYLVSLKGLSKQNPLLAASMAIILFSFAGIPPLAGFWSKMMLLFGLTSNYMYFPALVAVLASSIGAFYYLRVIKIMYFESPQRWPSYYQIGKPASIVIALSVLFILFFFMYPDFLFFLAHKKVSSILLSY